MKQVSGILLLLICAIGIFAWKEYDKQSRIAYLNNRISAKEVNDQQQKAHQKALAKKEAERKCTWIWLISGFTDIALL